MPTSTEVPRAQMREGVVRVALRLGAGVAGVSTLALLAAGSLVPLMGLGGGALAVSAVALLGNLGANALASWLDTWARNRISQAMGNDPQASDRLAEELASALYTELKSRPDLQRDVDMLLGASDAIAVAIEALHSRSDDQMHLLQQIATDVEIGLLLSDDLSATVLQELQAVRLAQREHNQLLVEQIDKLSTKILQGRAAGKIVNNASNYGAQGIFYDTVTVVNYAAAERSLIDLGAAQQLLDLLPLDYLPAAAPLPAGSRVLFLPSARFVNRKQYMQQIAEHLRGDERVVALTGMGGLGKTSLASEFAHRYGQYFAGGVFWLNCADSANIENEIAICGSAGLVARQDYHHLPPAEKVRLTHAIWQDPVPRLLIFDNCEDEAVLERYCPTTASCRVLITSRRDNWQGSVSVKAVSLGHLSMTDSVALLCAYQPDFSERTPGLRDLAEELGFLPLALHLAGSYLAYYKDDTLLGNPIRLLADLRDAQLLNHPALIGEDVQSAPTQHDLHIGRTFALSFDQLDSNDAIDAQALALLRHMTCMEPGKPIHQNLLSDLLNLPDTSEMRRLVTKARKRLTALGLLEQAPDKTLTLHRLIARFVRNMFADLSQERANVEGAVAKQIEQLNSDGSLSQEAHLYSDQVQFLARNLDNRSDELSAGLRNALGLVQWHQGNYAPARALFEDALAIRRTLLGEQSPKTAQSMNNLALVYEAEGLYPQAHALYEEALTILEQLLGPEDVEVAQLLNNLALLLTTTRDLEGAQQRFNRALTIRMASLGDSAALTLETRRNLAALLHAQGKEDEAFQLISLVHDTQQHTLSKDGTVRYDPSFALTLRRLAEMQLARGDVNAAQASLNEALLHHEMTLGQNHPVTTQTLLDLANVVDRLGDWDLARHIYDQALTNWRRVFGKSDHALIALTLHNLASVLQKLAEPALARQHYQAALTMRERLFGPNDPTTALTLNNLAYLLYTQEELDQAYRLYQRALIACETRLPADHPTARLVRHNLVALDEASARQYNMTANILVARQERELAHVLYERTLSLCKQALGEKHEMTQRVQTLLTTLE